MTRVWSPLRASLMCIALSSCTEAEPPAQPPPSTASPAPPPSAAPAPPPAPIERVARPARVCGSALEESVFSKLGPYAVRCSDPVLRTTYLRVEIDSHDVMLVQSVDMEPTYRDGPPDVRQWLWIDRRIEERIERCEHSPCDEPSPLLDSLGARPSETDEDLEVLLTMAIADPLRELLLTPEEVEAAVTSDWSAHAALLRSEPVGLRRSGEVVTLTALSLGVGDGWRGIRRTILAHTVTLERGLARASHRTLLDAFTSRVDLAREAAARRRQEATYDDEDPLAGLAEP